VDERAGTIIVLLKGSRDEHRVPVTDDFWPLYRQYLRYERQTEPGATALWVGLRKGKGEPLSYASFESSLRYIGRKLGANVNAHMFRHTLAQAVVDQGNLKVAQDLLGHQHLGTTADIYASTDQQAMVEAVCAAKSQFDRELTHRSHSEPPSPTVPPQNHYVFRYDDITLQELDQAVRRPSGPL
jgi:site-specific recombinase XerC